MKKPFLLIATLLAFISKAYGLPVGNPSDASMLTNGLFWDPDYYDEWMDWERSCQSWWDDFSFRLGYYGDFVFQRHLELRQSYADAPSKEIDHSQIFTNAGYLALNFWERFDVFATVGASNLNISSGISSFSALPVSDFRVDIESDTRFSWSIGARVTIWECACTTIGLEGQFFNTSPNVRRVTLFDTFSSYPTDARFRYREWQFGLGISQQIGIFVPYAAVKWSHVKLDTEEAISEGLPIVIALHQFRTHRHLGFALGVSLLDCDLMNLAIEGRWGDERAIYVNNQIRF